MVCTLSNNHVCNNEIKCFLSTGIGSFVLVPKGLHWRDANQYCRTHYGTQLVTIKNETKNEQVRQAASKARHGLIWIGYNDLAHEGKWSWADGSPKGFEKWKPGEPNNDKNEDVAEMIVGTGQWNDVGDGPRIFGCDYPEGQTIERDAYRLVLTKKTYDAAQMSCFSRYRTSIATISNEKQNTLIFNLAIQASGDRFDDLWIGLSDHLTEGIWLWEDRTPVTFQYWADGRPDNAHGGQHYTHMKMYDNGKWEDNDKNHEYPFVCNYRRFASVPNHKLTWHDANEFCKKHYKTQLGTITNKDSYQAAKGISTHNNDNSGIWFGLRCVKL